MLVRLHETVMLFGKLITESQEAMVNRIEAMLCRIEKSIEALTCKLVESQTYDQHHKVATIDAGTEAENVSGLVNPDNQSRNVLLLEDNGNCDNGQVGLDKEEIVEHENGAFANTIIPKDQQKVESVRRPLPWELRENQGREDYPTIVEAAEDGEQINAKDQFKNHPEAVEEGIWPLASDFGLLVEEEITQVLTTNQETEEERNLWEFNDEIGDWDQQNVESGGEFGDTSQTWFEAYEAYLEENPVSEDYPTVVEEAEAVTTNPETVEEPKYPNGLQRVRSKPWWERDTLGEKEGMEDPTIVEAAEEEITQVVTTNNQEIVVERQFDILQRAIIGGELEKWKNYCVEDNQDYKKISQAAEDGDWEKAKELLKTCPEGIDRVISICSETALLVAARNEQWMFVEEIVKLMSPEALELQDSLFGNTGLHYAAGYGKVKLAQLMAKKCPKLTQIRNLEGRVPLEFAVYSVTVGQLETVAYLYSVTTNELPSPFSGREGAAILCTAIQANMYDMALSLVKWFPNLVIMPYMEPKRLRSGICGLEMIIERPFTFLSGARLTWWERCIYSLIEVDMASPFDKMSFEDVNQAEETSRNHIEVSIEDEENPKESSNVSLTSVEHTNSTFISVHLMPYLTRASCIKRLCNKKLTHRRAFALNNLMLAQLNKIMSKDQIIDFLAGSSIIQTAIKYGTTEFVAECLKKFPFVMWIEIEGDRMINMAIRERNEKIVNLMCKNTSEKTNLFTRTDKNNSSILHHVAKLAPCSQLNRISGAVLQMQRELQWFKGIENMLPEEYKFMRNNSGETAQTIFTEEHKKLVEKGEKWLKETSGSCMVVAALIATVAFAAAFTVPGGSISDSNSNKNGTPIFLENNSFTLFAAADALALFSSITSVLMFLAILASRYAEEDFLKSLPQKLIIGLATLFLSMATILIAFGAALSIVVWNRFPWAPIPITILSCIPVILFVWLMFPLFVEMVWSTYKPSMFPGLSQHAIMQDNNKKEN